MMQQPENQSKKYDILFADIDTGHTKIPKFQRDFVWSQEKTADLIDSIIKGFPIGTFIFWKTRDEMRHYKNIGNAQLPEIPRGDAASYVLDGQQRITSLYAVRKGISITKEGEEIDYRQIAINLSLDPESTGDKIVTMEPPENAPFITVHKLLNGSIAELFSEYNAPDLIQKIDIYRKRLTGYDFSTIYITDCPIEIACEVFSRINTGGTELKTFEIVVAKTYDPTRNFDLAEEYEKLIDSNGKEKDLEDADYETIPESTVLQSISACLCGQVRTRDILGLNRSDFIDIWSTVKNGVFNTVDYFRTQLRIPVSRLLPYDALLVPFTYFFVKNNGKPPTANQNKSLLQYFWWASLSSRFTSGAEGKIAQDIQRINIILAGETPHYEQNDQIRLTIESLRAKPFSAGDAFSKAILCLLAYQEPKSFDSNRVVKLDNSWLRVATSKNYHHFFPRAYLERLGGFSEEHANSIVNITLVDDYLNKNKIKAKPPSFYMRDFKASNPELTQTMRTHFIDDLDAFGIWDNDYRTFIACRGERMLAEIQKRLGSDLVPA